MINVNVELELIIIRDLNFREVERQFSPCMSAIRQIKARCNWCSKELLRRRVHVLFYHDDPA